MNNDLQLSDSALTDELIEEFALAVLTAPSNRENVAWRLSGGSYATMNALLEAGQTLEFTQLVQRLNKETPANKRLKSRDDFVLEVSDKLNEMNGELWLKTAQFYAKLRGFTEDGININNTVNVMQVPTVPQTNAEKTVWESNASAYAKELQRQGGELDNGDT